MNSFFSNFMYFVLSSLHSFSIFSFTCPFVDECRGGMNDFCAKVYWIIHLQLKIFVLHFSPRLFFLIWCNVAEVLLFRCPASWSTFQTHCQWPKPFEIELSIRSFMFRTRVGCICLQYGFMFTFIIPLNIIAPPKISLLPISLLKISLLFQKYHCSKYLC